MTLFSSRNRTDGSPARHNEGHFAFMDRANTPFWARIRGLLDCWFEEFPLQARADLKGRFIADDRFHRAAWWELYLYASLIRDGWMLTPHPAIAGTEATPDFLAERGPESFYLEATTTGHKPAAAARERLLQAVYDVFNTIESPNFFFDLAVIQRGSAAPSTRGLRRALVTWLATLDPDAVDLSDPGGDRRPTFTWDNHDGWRFEIGALPKSTGARGRADLRPLGMYGPAEVRIVDHRGPLLDALSGKANRYGTLDRAYIIAVMDDGHPPPLDEILGDALYGTTAGVFDRTQHLVIPCAERVRDGFWWGQSGVGQSNVSGVLTAWNLSPWDIAKRLPLLWLHPAPHHVLPEILPWPTVITNPGSVPLEVTNAPCAGHDLFDLPADWPGPEGPFS